MKKVLIYFMKPVGLPGPIKIGCSRSPAERLKLMATWSPFELEVIAVTAGGLTEEKLIHDRFVHVHERNEWFTATNELMSGITAIQNGASIHEAFDVAHPRGNIRDAAIKKRNQRYIEKARALSALTDNTLVSLHTSASEQAA